MRKQYQTILAAAIASALMSVPAFAADPPEASTWADNPQAEQSQDARAMSGSRWSGDGAQRAKASDNKLYGHTPNDLTGFEVVGSDGKSIGKIAGIVMDPSRDDVHAVIASGGIMGMGARETIVPLSELKLLEGDKIQAQFNKDAISSRPEFKAEHYGVMESDRRISDFSAFEPTSPPEHRAAARADPATRADADKEKSTREVARTTEREAEERPSRLRSASEVAVVSLDQHTPRDMKGMEVLGKNCQSLGSVKSIVSSRDGEELHAVISSGGFLGLGSREIVVALDKLEILTDSQLQTDFNQDAVESLPEYQSGQYRELDADQPISKRSVTGR